MDWLAENGFWVLIGIVFIAMHLFGHGGHGGHGKDSASARDKATNESDDQKPEHRH